MTDNEKLADRLTDVANSTGQTRRWPKQIILEAVEALNHQQARIDELEGRCVAYRENLHNILTYSYDHNMVDKFANRALGGDK